MAATKPSRSLLAVGLFYLAESLLSIPSLGSLTVFLGFFLVARTAFLCQIILMVLGFYCGMAVMRQRIVGLRIGLCLSALGVANAVFVFLIPESRNMLIDLGARTGLEPQPALVEMGKPYVIHGILHTFALIQLIRRRASFR